MKADDVIQVLDALEGAAIAVWVGDGGWGIDALLGEQTRQHSDLDIIVRLDAVSAVQTVLGELSFHLVDGRPPTCFVLADRSGRRVDVHPVNFDDRGDGIYQMENGRIWTYPARGFSGVGVIAGRPVRCLIPDVELLCRTGYGLDAGDVTDMLKLVRRFGLELSSEQERARVMWAVHQGPSSQRWDSAPE